MDITQLFEVYQEERKSIVTLFDFASMITMYPGFLVANADGDFSVKEKQFLVDTLKVVTGEDWLMTCEMFSELSYLISHGRNKWEDEILTCLAESIAESNDSSFNESILNSMNAVAESEDGKSDVESQIINRLRDKLKI